MGMIMSNKSLGLEIIDLSDNTQVNSGGSSNTQTLQPNSGIMYIIRGLYYSAADPSGSTSGTHDLGLKTNDGTTSFEMFNLSANTGSTINISRNEFFATSENPGVEQTQYRALTSGDLRATNDVYLDFVYTNDTDANQTATRTLYILVEKIKVV